MDKQELGNIGFLYKVLAHNRHESVMKAFYLYNDRKGSKEYIACLDVADEIAKCKTKDDLKRLEVRLENRNIIAQKNAYKAFRWAAEGKSIVCG